MKNKIIKIIFLSILYSIIFSLFNINIMFKSQNPSKDFYNQVYSKDYNVDLIIRVKDDTNQIFDMPYLYDKNASTDTYQYLKEHIDNMTPYYYSFTKGRPNRILLESNDSYNFLAGGLPDYSNVHQDYYKVPTIILYKNQVEQYINDGYQYADLLNQELAARTIYFNKVNIGFYDSNDGTYKISGILDDTNTNQYIYEVISPLYLMGDVTLMNSFKYRLTGNYDQDKKVINLIFEESPLKNVEFELIETINYKDTYPNSTIGLDKKIIENSNKYLNNNVLYVIAICLLFLLIYFSTILYLRNKQKNNLVPLKLTNILIEETIYVISTIAISLVSCLVVKANCINFTGQINYYAIIIPPLVIFLLGGMVKYYIHP